MVLRNPHSLIYEGAPGWSLQSFLWIAARVREYIPDLTATIFLTSGEPPIKNDDPQVIYAHRAMFSDIQRKLKQPWLTVHERAAAPEDFEAAAVWCYPTHIPEDGSIRTARLAQLHGAIPVFNPIGALAQVVFAGIPVYGLPSIHPMAKCRYAYEIIALLQNEQLQEQIRVPMMERAKTARDEVGEIVTEAAKIQGWMTESELRWLATVAQAANSIVEIGCWKGRSMFALASACPGTVTAVDHWKGGKDEPAEIKEQAGDGLFATFMANVGHFPNLQVIRKASVEAAAEAPEADMVFIDGGHGFDDVVADIRAWKPKARKILAGHDFDWDSVKKAVAAELGVVEEGPGSIWFKVVERV